MARLFVVAVWDSAVQAYNRPFYVPATQLAVRSFTDEVNRQDEKNPMFGHPDDFELRLLATFEEDSGKFEAEDVRTLVRAKDVVRGGGE